MAQEQVQKKVKTRRVKSALERKRVKTVIKDESLTQQSHAKRANINNIMKEYGKTGLLPIVKAKPVYGDTPVGDYHAALNFIRQAEQQFMQLPAELRTEFDNDAGKFLDFINDDENIEKAREMGLAEPEIIEEPIQVEVVGDTPSTTTTPPEGSGGEKTTV